MKILVINNTIFYEEKDQLYLNKETGSFFVNLKNLDNDVSAFQISQLKTEEDSFANFNITGRDIKLYVIKRRKGRLLPFIKAFFKIQQVIRLQDFVYIFYPGPICQVIALLCWLHRKPFGIYVRGEQGITTRFSQLILGKAKVVLTISPDFTKKVSLINSNSFTIRPMISFDLDDIVVGRDISFGAETRILYVGRLVFDKGLFELLEAINILTKNNRNLRLDLVGGGTDYEKLRDYVKSNSLDTRVHFRGMISDKDQLKSIYMESDIFVLPTYHEGFPRVLYEAMMMRMPILTTYVGAISYLMKNEYNSLELVPKSVDSIVQCLNHLIDNQELAIKIAHNGVKTIVEYLDDKRLDHAQQLSEILRELR